MRKFISIRDGKSIHLRQGDLDGACTVYSLMMGLIAAKKVKKDALTDLDIFDREDKPDGRTSFARLLKEFFYKKPKSEDAPETILLRNGYTLEEIQQKLSILREAVATGSNRAVKQALMQVVPTYHAPEEVNSKA